MTEKSIRELSSLAHMVEAIKEQAERETVENIVAWLRGEAAVALWHDMDAFEPDTQEELDTIVSVLEAYADAIQSGEWK